VPELALAVRLVVLPLTFIPRAIRPHLDAATVTDRAFPLALVHCSILESILIAVLQRCCVVESLLTEVRDALLAVVMIIEGPSRLEARLPLL
jgi:hypothetical protein